jgi:hypothetical protein
MKRWRIHFKSKEGDQVMTLLAATKEKAEQEALRAQYRRHERFPLTFDRIQQAHDAGSLTPDQFKAEIKRRKLDQVRYDDDTLKIVSVTEVK